MSILSDRSALVETAPVLYMGYCTDVSHTCCCHVSLRLCIFKTALTELCTWETWCVNMKLKCAKRELCQISRCESVNEMNAHS